MGRKKRTRPYTLNATKAVRTMNFMYGYKVQLKNTDNLRKPSTDFRISGSGTVADNYIGILTNVSVAALFLPKLHEKPTIRQHFHSFNCRK